MGLHSTNLAIAQVDWDGSASSDEIAIAAPVADPLRTLEKWLTADNLSTLAGIASRGARKAIKSRRWRGCELQVREVEIGRGGASGKALQVHVDSLPADLRERWYFERGIDIHAKATWAQKRMVDSDGFKFIADPIQRRSRDRACVIHRFIAPAVNLEDLRSDERGKAVKELLGQRLVFPDGKQIEPTMRTIYNWIRAYEKQGINGLMRAKRVDTNTWRCPITTVWDKCFKDAISEDEYAKAAETIKAHIRGLWAGGAPGHRIVSEQSTTRLLEISEALNVPAFERLPLGRLGDLHKAGTKFGTCWLPRRHVEKEREYVRIAIKDRDNKLFQDKYAPSIRRDYDGLQPRDMVVGDVHPVDIRMLRADGTEVYPKAIAWFDPATNEIHMTFVICEKGEGIRREHVAQSFGAMVEEWGLPRLLYLDNGSEYKWDEMISGFTMLTKLAGDTDDGGEALFKVSPDLDGKIEERVQGGREAVIRSIAYNAKGKPGIEGAFSMLEQVFFSTIQGWTAGDRMNKKTHQKGKAPKPFDGTPQDFLEQTAQALEWYHKRPQQGRLNGRSPNETLNKFIEGGWGMTQLNSPEVMALAFATTETRTVDRGRVQFTPRKSQGTIFYYHDDLLPLGGTKVTVKVPAYDPQYVFVFQNDELVCLAKPEEAYHPLDGRGAEEVARRRAALNRHISEKRKSAALLSLVEDTARHLKHLPDAPEAPVAKTINVEMIDKMRALEAEERARLTEQLTATPPPLKVVDQWGVDDSEFTKGVVFLDDDEEEEAQAHG